MSINETKSNKLMSDYNTMFSRKKVFVPSWPTNMNPVGTFEATTTVALYPIGDQVKAVADVNSTHLIAPRLTASGDEVVLTWKVPDDFHGGEPTHVWMLWANDGPTTTTVRVSYDVKYSVFKVVDYAEGRAGEAITEPSTAMSTDLDETVKMDGLTKYAPYRSMRGTINGGLVTTEDYVMFKIEADAAPISNGTMSVLGLEIDYALRIRDKAIERYDP
jgi:hypothetical protein